MTTVAGHVRPETIEDLASVLAEASEAGTPTGVRGGGTHQAYGQPHPPELVIDTAAFGDLIAWEPDDLTVVVGTGMLVDDLENVLNEGGQSAVLPERAPGATVGGVIAAGVSPFRRLRYGPTRDRLLEVRAVTGDGRVIKGGGQVVKNVTGFDLPRLYAGSLGTLGVMTSVCLKLWPLTAATATVSVGAAEDAAGVYRPSAILETQDGVTVLLAGTDREVTEGISRLGGEAEPGHVFPSLPTGDTLWEVRVRPTHLVEAMAQLPDAAPFVAQHQVGTITVGVDSAYDVGGLRTWVEARGGAVVRVAGGSTSDDPWGAPPTGLELQRRVVEAFDPARILERGRLPGGI